MRRVGKKNDEKLRYACGPLTKQAAEQYYSNYWSLQAALAVTGA